MRCTTDAVRCHPAFLLAGALLLCSAPASAHLVDSTRSLRGFVAEAELVVHARIVALRESVAERRAAGGRPFVEAAVIEVLKGELAATAEEERASRPLRFVQHGHGVARYAVGQEALLFLEALDVGSELSALATLGSFRWVSLQEHDESFGFGAIDGAAALRAVRGYREADTASDAKQRRAALQRANLTLLTSRDAFLAAGVVRDLALDPTAEWLDDAAVEQLVALLRDDGTAIGVRVALLGELARRGRVDPLQHWERLLAASAPPRDRIAAIRAAGAAAAPTGLAGPAAQALRAHLTSLAEDPDPSIAAAAIRALGTSRSPLAVATIASALERESPDVRNAAIRALGTIRSADALTALDRASRTHRDPATRRRARAELRTISATDSG